MSESLQVYLNDHLAGSGFAVTRLLAEHAPNGHDAVRIVARIGFEIGRRRSARWTRRPPSTRKSNRASRPVSFRRI
jgi:hypothetical protein